MRGLPCRPILSAFPTDWSLFHPGQFWALPELPVAVWVAMRTGAFDLTKPRHLLTKLEHELHVLLSDPDNSFAAINGVRDAYHLREWIWNDRLAWDEPLQLAVTGSPCTEDGWNRWVNLEFSDFPIIRALCNGSKHLGPHAPVEGTFKPAYGSPISVYGGPIGYGVRGFFVTVDGGRLVSVLDLLQRVRDFWLKLFVRHPQLE